MNIWALTPLGSISGTLVLRMGREYFSLRPKEPESLALGGLMLNSKSLDFS